MIDPWTRGPVVCLISTRWAQSLEVLGAVRAAATTGSCLCGGGWALRGSLHADLSCAQTADHWASVSVCDMGRIITHNNYSGNIGGLPFLRSGFVVPGRLRNATPAGLSFTHPDKSSLPSIKTKDLFKKFIDQGSTKDRALFSSLLTRLTHAVFPSASWELVLGALKAKQILSPVPNQVREERESV